MNVELNFFSPLSADDDDIFSDEGSVWSFSLPFGRLHLLSQGEEKRNPTPLPPPSSLLPSPSLLVVDHEGQWPQRWTVSQTTLYEPQTTKKGEAIRGCTTGEEHPQTPRGLDLFAVDHLFLRLARLDVSARFYYS